MQKQPILELIVKRGWLAKDKNGDLWWYLDEPVFNRTHGLWCVKPGGSHQCDCICYGPGITSTAARNLLVKVDKKSTIELTLVTGTRRNSPKEP